MSPVLSALCLVAALMVVYHILHIASVIDVRRFEGHPIRFAALAACWTLFAAGALMVCMGKPIGGPMLLVGLAILSVADRRRA